MTDKAQKATILEAANTLRNLVANIGTTKDKRMYSFFQAREFDYKQLEDMYTNDWLSGKIIDIPANDAVRNWRKITTPNMDPKEIEQYEKAERDWKIKAKFNEALKWSYLYGGSLLFLGIEGSGNLEEPLVLEGIKKGNLKYIHVLDRWMVSASSINTSDPTKPNYQFPELYQLPGGRMVHHTRVIRFDGLLAPFRVRQRNNYWGSPILQRVYDAILNSQSFAEIVNTLVYEAKLDIISIPNLMQMLSTPNGEQQLIDRFHLADLLKSVNNTLLLDKEETHDRKQTTFSGLDALMNEYLGIVSAASDIPQTRLLGASPGGLNATGDSDLENYYDMISAKQENELLPALNYFDQVFARSILGYYPDDWDFDFKSLWQMSDKEKAEIQKMNAEKDQIYLQNGVISTSVVAKQLRDNDVYNAIDDEYITALESIEGLEPTDADLNNALFTNPAGGPKPPADAKGKWLAQSVILSKEEFTKAQAEKWIADHESFKNHGVDETNTSYRFRQYDPTYFATFRNDNVAKGITLVMGRVK